METFQRVIYGMPLFNEHNFEKVRTFVADGIAEAGGEVLYDGLNNAANEFEIEEICGGKSAAECVAELINLAEDCNDFTGFVVCDEDCDDEEEDFDTDQFIGFGQWFAFDNVDAKFRTEEEFIEVLKKYASILGVDEDSIGVYEVDQVCNDEEEA